MENVTNAELKSDSKYLFKHRSEEEKQKLLNEKDKKNTQRATVNAVKNFSVYLRRNKLANIEEISIESLNTTL